MKELTKWLEKQIEENHKRNESYITTVKLLNLNSFDIKKKRIIKLVTHFVYTRLNVVSANRPSADCAYIEPL